MYSHTHRELCMRTHDDAFTEGIPEDVEATVVKDSSRTELLYSWQMTRCMPSVSALHL
jgi:hypothetical protein